MKLQYLQDNNGNKTAIVIPIEDWNRFTENCKDLEELSQWKKNIINQRLGFIKNHSHELVHLQNLMKELDTDAAF